MKIVSSTPTQIFRGDYVAPNFDITEVKLSIQIFEDHAISQADLYVSRKQAGPLRLYGEALTLLSLIINGMPSSADDYEVDEEGVLLNNLPDACHIRISAQLNPYTNTALEGLYASGGMLCTQCEPQGFRRICFFPDRPDVMSVFTTRIEAPKNLPNLLSNGNLIEAGDLPDERHYAVWHDPHPKPSYRFALVAGALERVEVEFTTSSGRNVSLHIYVEPGNGHLTSHAMESLKKSMRWDEEVYGLEYDLDLFQIVAVSHFNMGAMENKGLNIFNSKYILADFNTATDTNLENVEAIVAHEYFHNWTGNRVTCRDWFQLTLKEGLTVFRDQCFTADQYDEGVKRAQDVGLLRAAQFPEDAGPTAHPIRPEAYAEINNFYTATVYEKGAEIIRMFHQHLGADGFRAGMDLYFARHDGNAVTCDDFVSALADANQVDLSSFMRWYEQAGTPTLHITRSYTQNSLKLKLKQVVPETAAKTPTHPVPIPVPVRLLDDTGKEVAFKLTEAGPTALEHKLLLDTEEASFDVYLADADSCDIKTIVPSWLRGFSAPVRLQDDLTEDERLHLAAFDSDLFNRWDSMQQLLTRAVLSRINGKSDSGLESKIAAAFEQLLADKTLNKAFQAIMMRLPSQAVLEAAQLPADPPLIYTSKRSLQIALASQISVILEATIIDYKALEQEDAASRALQNSVLEWGVSADLPHFVDHAFTQASSQNMTLSEGALWALNAISHPKRENALALFEKRWQNNALVMEKYFTLQASAPHVSTPASVLELMSHPQFDRSNPNKLRTTIGVFASMNIMQFHHESGSGYQFIAQQLAEIDTQNPQIAARMASSLARFGGYSDARQNQMREALRLIANGPMSRDLAEVVGKALEV